MDDGGDGRVLLLVMLASKILMGLVRAQVYLQRFTECRSCLSLLLLSDGMEMLAVYEGSPEVVQSEERSLVGSKLSKGLALAR